MSGQERWAYGLPEPVRKRPILSLTVGAVVGGFAVGLVIGWVWSR